MACKARRRNVFDKFFGREVRGIALQMLESAGVRGETATKLLVSKEQPHYIFKL
jgi:hypothetical protein